MGTNEQSMQGKKNARKKNEEKPYLVPANKTVAEVYITTKKFAQSYRSVIELFAKEMNKPITECNVNDVNDFLARHVKKNTTWNMWLSTLRTFYKWLYNKDSGTREKKWQVPAFFEDLDFKETESELPYGPNDIWTEDEILMAISALDHPRDKAMIAMLYDLAARPHELMKLKIGDIAMKENYAQVKLVDHTGSRVVPITLSFQYLVQWLNVHPYKDSPDRKEKPLWLSHKGISKSISPKGLYTICTRVLKQRLGDRIKKPFNPYCMGDHSRLTNLVEQGASEFDIMRLRGWKPNSRMPVRYIHMSGKGFTERMLERARINTPDKQQTEPVIRPKECYRCKHKNVPDAKYCVQCNFVLSGEAFEEMKQKENGMYQQLESITNRVNEMSVREIERDKQVNRFVKLLELGYVTTITDWSEDNLLYETHPKDHADKIIEFRKLKMSLLEPTKSNNLEISR